MNELTLQKTLALSGKAGEQQLNLFVSEPISLSSEAVYSAKSEVKGKVLFASHQTLYSIITQYMQETSMFQTSESKLVNFVYKQVMDLKEYQVNMVV